MRRDKARQIHAQGIGIAALEKALAQRTGAAVQRRTFQRRLERLLKDGRIVAEGQSIALVYKPALPGAVASVAEAQSGAEAELYVPVSPEGAGIRERFESGRRFKARSPQRSGC